MKIFHEKSFSSCFLLSSLWTLWSPLWLAFYTLRFRGLSLFIPCSCCESTKWKCFPFTFTRSPLWPRKFSLEHNSCVSFIFKYYDHSVTTTKTSYSSSSLSWKQENFRRFPLDWIAIQSILFNSLVSLPRWIIEILGKHSVENKKFWSNIWSAPAFTFWAGYENTSASLLATVKNTSNIESILWITATLLTFSLRDFQLNYLHRQSLK